MSGTAAPARPQGPEASLEEAVRRGFKARARWRIVEIAFWIAAAAAIFLPADYHPLLAEMAILGLFALSLDLILGYAGIVSLGHIAYFGIGVLVAGAMTKYWTAEPVRGLLAAGIAAGAFGLLAGIAVARTAGIVRVAVTIVIALALREAAALLGLGAGGADDIQDVIAGPILGRIDFTSSGRNAFGYCLAVLFLLFLLARRLVNSNFGTSLRLIKADPSHALLRGVPVSRRLVAAHAIAAGYAGVAGALLAQTSMNVPADIWSFERSIHVLLILVIGGTGYLYGGLIGAVLFILAQLWLVEPSPEGLLFGLGLALMLLGLVGRDRVSAWLAPLRSLFGASRAPHADASPAAASPPPNV